MSNMDRWRWLFLPSVSLGMICLLDSSLVHVWFLFKRSATCCEPTAADQDSRWAWQMSPPLAMLQDDWKKGRHGFISSVCCFHLAWSFPVLSTIITAWDSAWLKSGWWSLKGFMFEIRVLKLKQASVEPVEIQRRFETCLDWKGGKERV